MFFSAKRLCPALNNDKTPAKSYDELKAKLALLRGKRKLSYKDKLTKKGLKNRIKKKEKREKRQTIKTEKKNLKQVPTPNSNTKPKPVYNKEGKLIYSKFDFAGTDSKEKEINKPIKDPVVALSKIKEQDEKLKKLLEAGESEKLKVIVEKKAWKTALMKSEGIKVKDDADLLKKSIKKQKDRKEKSKTKWAQRENKIKKEQEERQRKRTDNIQARAKQKKLGKLKKSAKKGRIIAGF